ncbi:unnamed protein product [Cladocopium goreaui]|uniref:Uncharacterized protein n=1 Tax=Cladocopium goreaui TaxID=2562237 RepID=A0A9P1D9Z6_9DINO|nr:unnamed protein product [Cladocopium goreaui]|mmetsp:Transcript_57954/g.118005  ORF Transcript_57954/g.118005 Transcript_57954/m.118005 type:complete len:218 (+) Transcript_57954:42-695(+)
MDRITAPSVTQKVTSPPGSPTSWLKSDTGPMFPKDRAGAIRGERPRFDWVYDQAVTCTHDKLNGVLKTQLDVWHCPKTNGTQHILRASSHIVDTNARQSIARWYNKSFLAQSGQLVDTPDPLARPLGGGVTISHDGTTRPKRLQRCTTAPGQLQHEQYLPPWIEKSKYERALSMSPPSWAGGAYAARGHSATIPHHAKRFERAASLSSSGLPTFPRK